MAGTGKRDLSEIDAELRWVEDNIPAASGASFLPTDDIGFAGKVEDRPSRRKSDSKKKIVQHGWFASQPGWVQCLIAFAFFFVFLNLVMWLSGTGDNQDVATERGFSRVVPGRDKGD